MSEIDPASNIVVKCSHCQCKNRDPGPNYFSFTCGRCKLSLKNSPRLIEGSNPFDTLIASLLAFTVVSLATGSSIVLALGMLISIVFTLIAYQSPDRILQKTAYDNTTSCNINPPIYKYENDPTQK